MTIQIINLTDYNVFKFYSDRYKIYRDVYQPGLYSLEIREIHKKLAENVQKIVLSEKEMCYKRNNNSEDLLDLFIHGSMRTIKEISRKILSNGDEDLGYKIINVIKNIEEYNSISYKIGDKTFSSGNSYVMGILNITPDSFSDGGRYTKLEDAVNHALGMIDEGADIIDIGGESSRPGAKKISDDEELDRIIPVIDEILANKPNAIISIDTTKVKVADKSLEHGAKIINDISGLTFEPEILNVVKQYNASLILMHIKGTPENMQKSPYYDDLIAEIYEFLFNQSQIAAKAGIKNIFIDPGIGFGKTIEHNFEIIKRLEDFKSIGYPILIGASRKSFIGKTLNLEVNNRDTPTSIIEALAVKNGARIIRTHNVKNGVQVSKLLTHL